MEAELKKNEGRDAEVRKERCSNGLLTNGKEMNAPTGNLEG